MDSSTISPEVAQHLNIEAESNGFHFVDTPVSGGVGAAAQGTLTFMVGASNQDIYMHCKNYLKLMGKNIVNCGKPGLG